jgi:hypothetical protein
MKQVDDICEVLDWKTQFGPQEIVNIIANIIENESQVTVNNDLIEAQSKIASLQSQLERCIEKSYY